MEDDLHSTHEGMPSELLVRELVTPSKNQESDACGTWPSAVAPIESILILGNACTSDYVT